MIDLHCHILPGIDDGAADLSVSLAMAEAFVAGCVRLVACTPHILPGLYHNTGLDIRQRVAALQAEIDRAGIPLFLTTGADVHVAPGLAAQIAAGTVLTLADTRYLLLEPPHHVLPVRFEETVFELQVAGYVPIITHPERLSWIRGNYGVIQKLFAQGALMQITAGSLTGKFGNSPLYWAERMLDEGLVHILASDAHENVKRRPDLAEGYQAAERRVGAEEAAELVLARPRGIIENLAPTQLSRPRAAPAGARVGSEGEAGHVQTGPITGVTHALHRLGRRLRKLI